MKSSPATERSIRITSGNLNPGIVRLGLKALVSHILRHVELTLSTLKVGHTYPKLFLHAVQLRSKHGPVGKALHLSVSLDDDNMFHFHLRGLELLGEKEDSLDVSIPMGNSALSSDKLKALAEPISMEYLRLFAEHDDYHYSWEGLPEYTTGQGIVIHPTIPPIRFHQPKLGDEFSYAKHIVDLRTEFAWCLLSHVANTLPNNGELLLTMGKDKIVEFNITPNVRVGIWVIRVSGAPVSLKVTIPEGEGTHTIHLPIEAAYEHREVWRNVRKLLGECDAIYQDHRVEMFNQLHMLQGYSTTDIGTFTKSDPRGHLLGERVFTFNDDLGEFLGSKKIGFKLV